MSLETGFYETNSGSVKKLETLLPDPENGANIIFFHLKP